jgi:uroporphyrinogen decarboxylase
VSRNDDMLKAMRFESPEFIPVRMGILPAAWMHYREALDELVAAHPVLFAGYSKGSRDYDEIPRERFMKGEYVDPWGCVWCNAQDGIEAIVKQHPLPAREDVRAIQPPAENIGLPHGFMFLRLADLRGFEEIMVDFAEEPPELQMLIDAVLEYNMRQLEIKLEKEKNDELISFGDDLGHQHSLPISPDKWRKYMKPCYAKLYARCHQEGHAVYMHTDGHIYEIIPDLMQCGVNVINPQIRANGLDNLVRVCKGKVCVDLDLDRQLFPFASPAQLDEHVHECVEQLGAPEGGLWLKAEIDHGVSLENIEALCTALERYRSHFAPVARKT